MKPVFAKSFLELGLALLAVVATIWNLALVLLFFPGVFYHRVMGQLVLWERERTGQWNFQHWYYLSWIPSDDLRDRLSFEPDSPWNL
jgi:hypothetical protein